MTMRQLPPALAPLAAYRQFVLCRFTPDPTRPGKTIKMPVHPATFSEANAHDPAVWLDATTACHMAEQLGGQPVPGGAGWGVGFTFTKNDPFFFVDIDGCLQADGTWSPIVHELCSLLNGAAVEISQSGAGLHIIGSGDAGPTEERRKKDNTKQNLFDLYTEDRFVALTGNGAQGNAASVHTPALGVIVDKYLRRALVDGAPAGWTTGPDPTWNGPKDDDELLRRAMRSQSARSAFGASASFADLWERNVEVLRRVYPPDANNPGDPYNGSVADMALTQLLAFWTGRDCERMKRLLLRSGLVREKWKKRESYLDDTILAAVSMQTEWLTDKTVEAPAAVPASSGSPQPKLNEGATYVSVSDQIAMFAGCVYVSDQNRILVPGGHVISKEQFKVRYGGYTFPMDLNNEMRPSRDAWEVFTQSQAFRAPRADSTCFRPDLPAGAIVDEHDFTRVNTFWPIKVERKVGDPSPFLRHLEKLLPNERDRAIMLAYMCAVVQYQGFKIKWAPLIQGVEGNGKSFLSLCVEAAVGKRYTHWPRADQISEKFNAWLFDKVFIGVEDIYVPESQQEVIEVLKPMITGESLAKRAMNTDQVNANIVCNFILNSNHKGAIRKTRNDRRFAMLYCAQQQESDLVRDGMDKRYMQALYDWFWKGGSAIVAELLHTMPIPAEFDPKGECQRAPTTSSTEEAIGASRSSIEQEILEAIEQGAPGFADGWISSTALAKLLESKRRSMAPNRQRETLVQLGYDWHPGLTNGRVDNTVQPDGTRPKLYIRKGHPMAGLVGSSAIAAAYSDAQLAAVGMGMP
jgi:hypothetical protein